MPVRALAKGVKISPRKVSVVVALVRDRSVNDAITILEHTPRRAALPVRKLLESAKANAEHNANLKPDTLQITQITVTPGPRMKRYRPAAHGRALPYQKKSTHISITVDGEKRVSKKSADTKMTAKKEAK